MDHDWIEEHEVVERYRRGTLPPEEAARFEEHYLSCADCLDRLELAEAMGRGFKRAAGQEVAALAVARPLALVAWLSRLGRWRQTAALLFVVVACAGLPGLLGWRQARELSAARAALEAERARAASGSRAEEEAARLRGALAQEKEARTEADRQLDLARRPQRNVPLLSLAAERGGGEPTQQLRLPSEPGWVVLSLLIEPPHAPSYRATLRDPRGRELWRAEGLRPDENDSLSLGLPTSLLAPGDHTVTLEGAGPRPAPPLRFSFRVLPAR